MKQYYTVRMLISYYKKKLETIDNQKDEIYYERILNDFASFSGKKRCSVCNKWKSDRHFDSCNVTTQGLRCECHACRDAYKKELRERKQAKKREENN